MSVMKHISLEAMLYELREGLCLLGTADEQYSYLCNKVSIERQYEGIAIGLSGCQAQVCESITHAKPQSHINPFNLESRGLTEAVDRSQAAASGRTEGQSCPYWSREAQGYSTETQA